MFYKIVNSTFPINNGCKKKNVDLGKLLPQVLPLSGPSAKGQQTVLVASQHQGCRQSESLTLFKKTIQ